jgi:leukotriene-A4 hydrolase
LQDDVKRYGAHHPYTALVPTLPRDVDPDDLFSSVPYEKGFAFLRKLEDLVGQADFEAWIKKDFFPTFRLKSINSQQVRDSFTEKFPDAAKHVQWESEYINPGMPTPPLVLSTKVRDECNEVADRILAADKSGDVQQLPSLAEYKQRWQGRQHVAFLERFHERLDAQGHDASLSTHSLGAIDNTMGYSDTYPNNEVAYSWYALCLRSRGAYTRHVPAMNTFLSRVGRMKFVRPLYRSWAAFDLPAAAAWFAGHKARYHPITAKMVQQDFDAAAKKQ